MSTVTSSHDYLCIKNREAEANPAVNVDLGGAALSLKPREASPEAQVEVDLGGAGLSIKRSSDDDLDLAPLEALGPLGDELSGVVDSLPVDVSVDAPVLPRADRVILEPVVQYS